MNKEKTAVVLINIGTPDSPAVKEVRKYLTQFLNDPRVIDIPWLLRKILVNLIIVPFRAPKSARLYQLLWTPDGSPLTLHSQNVRMKLQERLGTDYALFVAMRYGNPSIRQVLEEIRRAGYPRILVVPMYPHYASSSTGSTVEAVMKQVAGWNVIPEVKFAGQFYRHPGFIEAFTAKIKAMQPERYDHLIFSYHGLPIRHIDSVHPGSACADCSCDKQFPPHGTFCYRATCYETTRLLAGALGLQEGSYSHSFQSRLSDKWLKPFTDELLARKAVEGVKKILIVAPAFVADCLETTVELGIEYKKLFLAAGGERLDYTESLNDDPLWIEALEDIVRKG